ncbi:riboflavin biosynthesis protein RibF [Rickettsiales endosymbiont of Peranema trichophorum]|uniref:riboflavin biosynthesis protein RibF n=1 Tax=Rickettsiales endosymbiont of Peranema trichophorum TaxID=2486577 RepID=UPI001023DFB9|nr:riboflavin biosynthesis protein RibF [Rickettsiales endosymbiont of Peranema trichophorum]RZI47586.1 riboflavin biosynthesis protein RibF [Rickettsiales endosymbiont of Peranema trichophorum]
MKIVDGLESFHKHTDWHQGTSLAIGNFDGMHIGHQLVIKRCVQAAKDLNITSAVITFIPHPSEILSASKQKHLNILDFDEKAKIIQELGVDTLLIIHFNHDVSHLSPSIFLEDVLIRQLKMKHLVTGSDFHFGQNREGNQKLLVHMSATKNFTYERLERIKWNEHQASSSNVKALMQLGAFRIIKHLLGRWYHVSGIVSRGDGVAGRLGIPTANIKLRDDLCHPLYGVYLIRAEIQGQVCYGIANVGVKPTFLNSSKPTLEAHFFQLPNVELHGQHLKVELLHFIRPERKFAGIEDLKTQIQQDITFASQAIPSVLDESWVESSLTA